MTATKKMYEWEVSFARDDAGDPDLQKLGLMEYEVTASTMEEAVGIAQRRFIEDINESMYGTSWICDSVVMIGELAPNRGLSAAQVELVRGFENRFNELAAQHGNIEEMLRSAVAAVSNLESTYKYRLEQLLRSGNGQERRGEPLSEGMGANKFVANSAEAYYNK